MCQADLPLEMVPALLELGRALGEHMRTHRDARLEEHEQGVLDALRQVGPRLLECVVSSATVGGRSARAPVAARSAGALTTARLHQAPWRPRCSNANGHTSQQCPTDAVPIVTPTRSTHRQRRSRVIGQAPGAATHEARGHALVRSRCPRHPRPALPPAQQPRTRSARPISYKLRVDPVSASVGF
jgi:hypothetical protein